MAIVTNVCSFTNVSRAGGVVSGGCEELGPGGEVGGWRASGAGARCAG